MEGVYFAYAWRRNHWTDRLQILFGSIVRFTVYFCLEFMEISKAIHYWKAYNVRSPKNNVYICAALLDPFGNFNTKLAVGYRIQVKADAMHQKLKTER